jgi:hypothetical protein
LISALIVVLSSASRIWDLCCMNLLTKFRNGSLSFYLQLYRSDDSAVVSWNIWNACMNFVLRTTQLQTECGCSREYQFRIGPSQAMMKDLASATSSPSAEFTADSYLMRNCIEFPKPLYFGRETGLNFGGHGVVCSPMDSGDYGWISSLARLVKARLVRARLILAHYLSELGT